MEKTPRDLLPMAFQLIRIQLKNANKRFPPVLRVLNVLHTAEICHTTVQITCVNDQNIKLGATFSPKSLVDRGLKHVAGIQTVNTLVRIDFNKQLPLYWMASVLTGDEISPNQATNEYSSDTDKFTLPMNPDITLSHDSNGWNIPAYDSKKYHVNVGFGMGVKYICWGYSVPCNPSQQVLLQAGSYELFKSNGQEQIGDPVAVPSQGDWLMAMGYSNTLAFDESGVGTLTSQ